MLYACADGFAATFCSMKPDGFAGKWSCCVSILGALIGKGRSWRSPGGTFRWKSCEDPGMFSSNCNFIDRIASSAGSMDLVGPTGVDVLTTSARLCISFCWDTQSWTFSCRLRRLTELLELPQQLPGVCSASNSTSSWCFRVKYALSFSACSCRNLSSKAFASSSCFSRSRTLAPLDRTDCTVDATDP